MNEQETPKIHQTINKNTRKPINKKKNFPDRWCC